MTFGVRIGDSPIDLAWFEGRWIAASFDAEKEVGSGFVHRHWVLGQQPLDSEFLPAMGTGAAFYTAGRSLSRSATLPKPPAPTLAIRAMRTIPAASYPAIHERRAVDERVCLAVFREPCRSHREGGGWSRVDQGAQTAGAFERRDLVRGRHRDGASRHGVG